VLGFLASKKNPFIWKSPRKKKKRTGLKPTAKRMKLFLHFVQEAEDLGSLSPKGFILLAVGFSPVLLNGPTYYYIIIEFIGLRCGFFRLAFFLLLCPKGRARICTLKGIIIEKD